MLGMPPPGGPQRTGQRPPMRNRSHFTDGEAEALTRREGPRQHREPRARLASATQGPSTGPSSLPVALPSLAPVCLQWEAFVSA